MFCRAKTGRGQESLQMSAPMQGTQMDPPAAMGPPAASSVWSVESDWHTLHGGGATQLDDIHKAPMISRPDCDWIVQQCEQHVGSAGWQQSLRHKAAPTTDVEVESVPALHEWHQQWLRRTLYPIAARMFGIPSHLLLARESFIVRYAASEQRELNWHRDGAVLSFVAALNEPPAYTGGGTQFWSEELPSCSLAQVSYSLVVVLVLTLHCRGRCYCFTVSCWSTVQRQSLTAQGWLECHDYHGVLMVRRYAGLCWRASWISRCLRVWSFEAVIS